MRLKILLILLLTSFALSASAHEEATEENVNFLVHLTPYHQAIAGVEENINIGLINSEKEFTVEKCKCIFSISQVLPGDDEKEIFSTRLLPLVGSNLFSVKAVPFTFPKEGEYHLNIKGQPLIKGTFTPFEVEVKEEVLPVGSTAPMSDEEGNVMDMPEDAHHHSYPKVMLGAAGAFTLVMGYFLFAVPKPKNKN